MDISSKTRIYGILEAIDKSGNFGTVSTDNSVKLRVKFDGSTTCAYTGDTCTLKTGDKLSFIPNKNNHIIVATDTHIFNYEDKASSSFDETDSISDTFYEIHQRDSINEIHLDLLGQVQIHTMGLLSEKIINYIEHVTFNKFNRILEDGEYFWRIMSI